MLIPVISIVGSKDSGKTTIARNLIAEFTDRGYKVAAAKHSHHDFNFSAEGRDTRLFEDAGARSVFFIGNRQTVCIHHIDSEEQFKVALARYARECDIVVAEGWRRSSLPKVLVYLEKEKVKENDFPVNIKAVVCPVDLEIDAPHFKPEEIEKLTDYLLKEVLVKPGEISATVAVNGQYVPTKGFVQQFIAGGALGMISSLKGVEDVNSVEIIIKVNKNCL